MQRIRARRAQAGPPIDLRAWTTFNQRARSARDNADPTAYAPKYALQLAPVQGAVGFLARTAARSEIIIEKKQPKDGRWLRVYDDLPQWADPARTPSNFQTTHTMRSHLARAILIGGSGYIMVLSKRTRARRLRGYADSIVTLSANRVSAYYKGGTVKYKVSDAEFDQFSREADEGDVIPLYYWQDDDEYLQGVSPLAEAAPPLRVALAAEAQAELLFQQGGLPPSLLIAAAGSLSDEYAETIKQYYTQTRADPEQRHKPLLLEGEWNWLSTFVPPEQMQLLDSRRFSWSSVSAIYGVPPPFMGSPDVGTWGTGVRQLMRFALIGSVEPLLGMISDAFTQLLPDGFRCRLSPDHLLEIEPLEKARYYERALAVGWLTIDEVRIREGLPELPPGYVPPGQEPDTRDRGDSDSGNQEGEENNIENAV